MIVHIVQRRLLWKNVKFWAVVLGSMVGWGYLWYEGFKTF